MEINPTKRLNKLTEHAQNLLQSDFSDWAAKDRLSSNFDRLNEKMLAAYNRCGGGPNGTDDDEDEPSKGKLFYLQRETPIGGENAHDDFQLQAFNHIIGTFDGINYTV